MSTASTIYLETPIQQYNSVRSTDQAERLLEDLAYATLLRQRILATYEANGKYLAEMLKLPGCPTNF